MVTIVRTSLTRARARAALLATVLMSACADVRERPNGHAQQSVVVTPDADIVSVDASALPTVDASPDGCSDGCCTCHALDTGAYVCGDAPPSADPPFGPAPVADAGAPVADAAPVALAARRDVRAASALTASAPPWHAALCSADAVRAELDALRAAVRALGARAPSSGGQWCTGTNAGPDGRDAERRNCRAPQGSRCGAVNSALLTDILAGNTFCCITLMRATSVKPDHESIIVLPVTATPDFPTAPADGTVPAEGGIAYLYPANDALGYVDGWWCEGGPQFYPSPSNVATTMNNPTLEIGLYWHNYQAYVTRNATCTRRTPHECECEITERDSAGRPIYVGPGCFASTDHPRGWYCEGRVGPICDEPVWTLPTDRTGERCASNYYTGNCPTVGNQAAFGTYNCRPVRR